MGVRRGIMSAAIGSTIISVISTPLVTNPWAALGFSMGLWMAYIIAAIEDRWK